MNPLDWTGPQFLMLYVPVLFVGYMVARVLSRPPRPTGDLLRLGKSLDPYEVALLYGPDAFRDAVAASLVHRGVFRLEEDKLVPSEAPPADLTPLERRMLQAAGGQPLWLAALAGTLEEEASRVRQRLTQKGLLMGEEQARELRRTPSLVFGAVLALGFVKLLLGLARDRPVFLLFVLLVIGLIGWVSLRKVKRGRTPLGDKTLRALRHEHTALRDTLSSRGSTPTLSGGEVALGVALFGTTALAATELAPLRRHLPPTNSGTSGGGGGDCADSCGSDLSSCGGGDSGGGDSGGGDSGGGDSGGGGGCGGCGGGD